MSLRAKATLVPGTHRPGVLCQGVQVSKLSLKGIRLSMRINRLGGDCFVAIAPRNDMK
jgi:hypothetical protein